MKGALSIVAAARPATTERTASGMATIEITGFGVIMVTVPASDLEPSRPGRANKPPPPWRQGAEINRAGSLDTALDLNANPNKSPGLDQDEAKDPPSGKVLQ